MSDRPEPPSSPPPLPGPAGSRAPISPPSFPPPPPPGTPPGPSPAGPSGGLRRVLLVGGAALLGVGAVGGIALVVTDADDDDDIAGPGLTGASSPEGSDVTAPTVTPPEVTAPVFTLPDLTLPDGTTAPVVLTVPDLSVPATIVVSSTPGDDVPAPTEEPTGLGTDDGLDELARRCFDGGLIACDVLYVISPVDSPYETYGDTCAGRQAAESNAFCAKFVSFPGPNWDLGASATEAPEFIDGARCWAGDMAACDVVAKTASAPDLVDLGTSCAGRQEVGAGDCVGAFPEYEPLLDPT